jgi:hypothetical protein
LAVVLSSTPGSLSTNAWPARPRRALPRHIVDPATTPRIYCVPRIAAARARFIDDASLVSTGAALLIETGAHPEIAIIGAVLIDRPRREGGEKHANRNIRGELFRLVHHWRKSL